MNEQHPPGGSRRTTGRFLRLVVAVELPLLALAWVLGSLVGAPVLGGLQLTPAAALWGLAATIPSVLLIPWSIRSAWPPVARLRRRVYELVLPLVRDSSLVEIILISALAGACEEAFFRGAAQAALAGVAGPWIALAVTSATFGLLHAVTPLYAVLAALLGAYWGGLALASGNLLAPMLAHAAHDLVALIVLRRMARGT